MSEGVCPVCEGAGASRTEVRAGAKARRPDQAGAQGLFGEVSVAGGKRVGAGGR